MYSKAQGLRWHGFHADFTVQQGDNMARHYVTRDFFRQMPNALLARYFRGKALLAIAVRRIGH